MTLTKQSLLHSFIVDSREWCNYESIFSCDDLKEINDEIHQIRHPKRDYILEEWQSKVIDFFESPESIRKVLREVWCNVFTLDGPEPVGYEDFYTIIIGFMNDICRFYNQYGSSELQLYTSKMTEKNFMTLWGYFFNALWINDKIMKYNDGEITSVASTYRRNGVRSLEDNQSRGHKTDAAPAAAKARKEVLVHWLRKEKNETLIAQIFD
jgi:hypothetical protein